MINKNFLIFLLLVLTFDFSNVICQDESVLLKAKTSSLVDPNGRLNDWIPGTHPCTWTGISCDSVSLDVTTINLSSFGLSGGFPSGFCGIKTLRSLDLGYNFLNGTVSGEDLTHCSGLQYLNLSLNCFVGGLPDFVGESYELVGLDLSQNNFSGEIPPSYGMFPALRQMNLFSNLLDGVIPSFLGNLSELVEFNLAYNTFKPGPLPPEIGNLTKLEILWLPFSNLVGEIPESIGKLVNLRNLDLSDNDLAGAIPDSIGRLESVTQIELYRNLLSGTLPKSLGNLSLLKHFDASENALTGRVPERFAGLHLISLGLNDNYLQGEIPDSISWNPNLIVLKLFNNSFSGELPPELGHYSNLEVFDVSSNGFVGELPNELCRNGALRSLITFNNRLSGGLPESYGECESLSYIRIQNNLLSGTIPDRIWSLPMVYYLEIRNNFFQGSISPAIFSAKNLTQLMISSNNFSGVIPPEICNLSQLSVIDAKRNNFSGDLPHCISNLTKLEKLDLQSNGFTGEIQVGFWQGLTELNLSCNKFSGEIPAKLGYLPALTYLDLSLNRLSGNIPIELGNLRANSFNLSYNNLSGRIPAAFATGFYLPSLLGNPNLCSDASLPPFPLCSRKPINSLNPPRRTALITTAVLFLAGVAFLSGYCWIHYRKRMRTKSKRIRPRAPWKVTSFHRVGLTESDILDCLREDNLIGSGGSGRVYKVTLKTGQVVAVKKLWSGSREPQAEKDFRSEVETLGWVRHGNIVKLLFCCAAEDVRLLVYEYMENGSLGDVLHCEKGGTLLDWDRRVKIAVGSAQGLAYLHHDYVPPIVHRDVKANNILLDGEFCARIADFGLARILKRIGEDDDDRVVTRVVGSCGYIAPEYGYTLKVNEKSDVYSFGVVLLELVTGRKAIEQEFGEGKDIVRWSTETMAAAQAKEQGSEEVELDLKNMLDPRLNPTPFEYQDMVRVLKIGLLCTSSFPINRPTMRNVVEMLKDRRHVSSSAHVSSK